MNLLLSCIDFSQLSGSPVYFYELSRTLVERGHRVTLVSNIGGEITRRAAERGVRCVDFARYEDLPFREYDAMVLSQLGPAQFCTSHELDVPAIMVTHSEFTVEEPLIHPRIKRYVAIRPSIVDKLTQMNGIDPSMVEVVYNPMDTDRFTPGKMPNRAGKTKTVLFAGQFTPQRMETVADLVARSVAEGFHLTLVGDRMSGPFPDYADPSKLPSNVRWYPSTWDVERHLRNCDETAGILYGRTTTEGWLCGKPGWIYSLDRDGHVTGRELSLPDRDELVDRHDRHRVSERIERIIESVI